MLSVSASQSPLYRTISIVAMDAIPWTVAHKVALRLG